MRRNIRPTVYLLAFLLCTPSLTGCRQEKTKETGSGNHTAAAVHVLTIKTERSTSTMEIMGTVQADDHAVIAARISGHITELPVALGSRVNKGDLLVKINAAEIAAQLLQAKAQLAQADRNLQREKTLLQKGASTPETVRALEDTHRIAAASVNEVQTMLGYATISAPFAGIVTQKNANIGDLAVPGKPLLAIENETRLQVVANIPETMVLKIKVGDDIPLSIPSADFTATGRVKEISPAADPLSRTAPIKLSLPANPNVRSGQFARVSLPEHTVDTISVPQSALLAFGQMERVFTVVDQTARLRLVRTGGLVDGRIEILAGLEPGDRVVISGNKDLVDGQSVTIDQ